MDNTLEMNNYSSKWIIQRVTAVLLIPLTFWFVYNCVLFSKSNYNDLILFFSSYTNSLLFLIMMIVMLIHSKYGCETIIEDYIVSKKIKKIALLTLRITIYLVILISLTSLVVIIF